MSKITKAIIPVAGYGTRRLPITKAIEKCMLPIGNRPIVDYIVEDCARAGITDIYFVINDTPHSQLMDYYGENAEMKNFLVDKNATDKLELLNTAPAGVNFHYVKQTRGKYGTAIPVADVVRQFDLKEQIVMRNGDDPFWNVPSGSEVKNMIALVENEAESATIGATKPTEEMPRYGMLVTEDDFLKEIIEKPSLDKVVSNLANINCSIFSAELLKTIVEYVDSHDFGPNDQEYMITDPIAEYLHRGGKMRVGAATGDWLDSGNLTGWLHANEVIGHDLLKNQ
jgi:UTP--glucose-1-phosphate uridylyltransferase